MDYIYIILAIIVLIVIYCFLCYNRLVKLNNEVEQAFATMDVELKKRWELIPKLVDSVKAYTKYEKDAIESITKLREDSYERMNASDKIKSDEKITPNINKLLALKENYPNLKASDNYVELSKELVKIEEDIAMARKYYNGTIREYNNKVQTIPSNIVASILGFKAKEMLKISESEKQDSKIEL